MFRGEATEEENLEEMVRTANPEEITIDEDDDDDEETIEGNGEWPSLNYTDSSLRISIIFAF